MIFIFIYLLRPTRYLSKGTDRALEVGIKMEIKGGR